MKRVIIGIVLSMFIALHAQEQGYRLSIDELFAKSMEHSVRIRSAEMRTQIATDRTALAKNKQLPDVGFSGSFGYAGTPVVLNTDLSFMQRVDNPDWKQNYQINVSQPLYTGGQIKGNIEKEKLEQKIADLSLLRDKSELKLFLVGQYLDLFNSYKQLEVYKENIEQAKVRLHDIEQMKSQGMLTNNDVLRTKLLITNYELAYKTVANNIKLISQQLAIVMGMDEETIYRPDEAFLLQQLEVQTESDYVLNAYGNYPDLQIAEVNVQKAQTDVKLAKASLYPTLSLQLGNAFARPIPNSSPAQDFYVNSWGISLNLSYNISAWFDKKHNVGMSKRQVYMQELVREEQKQTIRTSVRSAYVKHKEALDRIEANEESLIQAKENYRIVNNKYFNQLAILTDLLDANAVLLDTELQMINAQTNAIYTYYQLQKVSGRL